MSIKRILSCLNKKKCTLSNKTLNLLYSNSKKLALFLTNSCYFKLTQPWVTFLGDENQHHQPPVSIHIDKLLVSLSFPTVSMFQFILGSRLKQKRFLPAEKMLISKIVKLCKQIKSSSIPSLKIRSIVNNFS